MCQVKMSALIDLYTLCYKDSKQPFQFIQGMIIARKAQILMGVPNHYGYITAVNAQGQATIMHFWGRNKTRAHLRECNLLLFMDGGLEFWIAHFDPTILLPVPQAIAKLKSLMGVRGWTIYNNCEYMLISNIIKPGVWYISPQFLIGFSLIILVVLVLICIFTFLRRQSQLT